MADSRLIDVIDYLEQLLQNSSEDDLSGVTISWGPFTDDERPDDIVYVGYGRDGTSGETRREWGPIGQQRLDEEIDVPITVEASIEGNPSNKDVFQRSEDIANAVEREIRSDITAGDSLLKGGRLRQRRGEFFRLESRGHRVFMTFTGTARI